MPGHLLGPKQDQIPECVYLYPSSPTNKKRQQLKALALLTVT